MSLPELTRCPGTLKEGHSTFSPAARNRLFGGHAVHHVLPYPSPATDADVDARFTDNRRHMSISGVQEKLSIVLEKNKLRLAREGERGSHILKPIPNAGRHRDQMPANEHVSMQIARQVFGIETAENALIFFQDGAPAYITKRFDRREDGTKWAQEDFAALDGRTPQTHGTDFKYVGNYLDLFRLLERFVPAYPVEAPKLFKRILFNYLISNGDAHIKNFSLLQTPMGDFKLSPAYDLLNSRLHIDDTDFALHGGLLPPALAKGRVGEQFRVLAEEAHIPSKVVDRLFGELPGKSAHVVQMVGASFLELSTQRNFLQSYQTRVKRLLRA